MSKRGNNLSLAATAPVLLALLLAACGSSDSVSDAEPAPTSIATAPTSEASGEATDPPEPDEAPTETEATTENADPAPPTRRTDLADVLLDPNGPGAPPSDFIPSAVAVDAWPVAEVLPDLDEAALAAAVAALEAKASPDEIVVVGAAQGCVPMVAWALPEPEFVTMGIEFHPGIQCVRAADFSILALVPRSGENSQGVWDYAEPPEVVVSPRIGHYVD